VNFSHLEHLTEAVSVEGRSVNIVHIYATYPDYEWLDAKESGPEGIACVDDAARAAVLYLRDYELNRRRESLNRAGRLLEFVLTMQAGDGEFWNFIRPDRSINREGTTSFKSFGWWAARGVWCLGHGYRVFRDADSAFAVRLREAMERSLPHVRSLLAPYGETGSEGGYRIPRWLLYGSGADATSELLLGLVEYYRASASAGLEELIRKLADGLMVMQDGDPATFPHGLHRSWRTLWHMWGNSQTQALAAAGKALGDPAMVQSAQREAEGFYTRLLCEGFFSEMDIQKPVERKEFAQIAYGVRPMAVGLIRLYEATGQNDYLRLAGLAASWLFGNNSTGVRMYDPATGRCFDGINDVSGVNRNSGAESTIEALLTLVEVQHHPEAARYIHYKRISTDIAAGEITSTFEGEAGERLTLRVSPRGRRFVFEESAPQ
jgi:hypothetical protein